MHPNRKLWNAGQQQLKRAFASGDREKAIALFLDQHAMVHSAKMARRGLWSFEDEVLNGLSDAQIRRIPPGAEHSIAWILLHLARIEDITMNMLVAGAGQLFTRGGWAKKMNIEVVHSANSMSEAAVKDLSTQVDVRALRAYRLAVGRRTRQIVQKLKAQDFKKKVNPERLQTVLEEGAVVPEALEIVAYWGSRTLAGLLLMPPTRHCILHWNEAERIRKQLAK